MTTKAKQFEDYLDSSGVPAMLAALMPTGGRPRQVPVRTILLGMLLATADGRPAQMVFWHRALVNLPRADKCRLKVAKRAKKRLRDCTYRQFSDTFSHMVATIDPSPVPSFRTSERTRAERLAEARRQVEAMKMAKRLDEVTDDLLEASIPYRYKSASRSLAVDWTDYETWSRPREKDDPEPANDADASWGHCRRNAPGAVEGLFFGFYAQVATMVMEDGGPSVPELIRRIAFETCAVDPARVMTKALLRMAARTKLGDILYDCGYSNRDPKSVATPLRRAGASLVMDLHPQDRGMRGTYLGAVCANGQLYCPAVPKLLADIGPLKRGASKAEAEAYDARARELFAYRFGHVSAEGADGYCRRMCPAAAGKVRCPLKPASLGLPASLPTVTKAPENPEACCRQATITVPPHVNEKTRQRLDYGGPEHRRSYSRRTAAERSFAHLADVSTGAMPRGWSRMFGVAKNALCFAIAAVVQNFRIVASFERKAAREAEKEGHKHIRRRPAQSRRPRAGTTSPPKPTSG